MRVLIQDSATGQIIVEAPAVGGHPPETIYVEVTGPPTYGEEGGRFFTGPHTHEVFALSPAESAIGVEAVYNRVDLHPSEAQATGHIVQW